MIFTSCQLAQDTTYLLEMYIHFPVIRLVTFVQEAFKPHFKNQAAGRIPHRLSQEGERGQGVIGQALGTNIRYVWTDLLLLENR